MSDVGTGSPPPSAPAAPSTPAPANEVVINPNPTSTPSPVGPQAPERPPGELDRGHGRPETRRESIRKAFERANAPEKEKTPAARKTEKAAKPVEGKTADQPLDLRKPPQAQERYREGGRFAKAPDQPASQTDPAAGQQPGQPQSASAQKPVAALPDDAPYRETPQRFSERGKAEWAATPEGVRGDVHRMAKEFEGAYTKLRGDHEEMNTIRNFHQMATEHGTTLQKALTNYVSMEQKLRADPIGGLDVIVLARVAGEL